MSASSVLPLGVFSDSFVLKISRYSSFRKEWSSQSQDAANDVISMIVNEMNSLIGGDGMTTGNNNNNDNNKHNNTQSRRHCHCQCRHSLCSFLMCYFHFTYIFSYSDSEEEDPMTSSDDISMRELHRIITMSNSKVYTGLLTVAYNTS